MKKLVSILIIILLSISCGKKIDLLDENVSERFNLGMQYFEKEKYLKAETEFNYLILNNPGSKLALDAQYYIAESMFHQEKYHESIMEYDMRDGAVPPSTVRPLNDVLAGLKRPVIVIVSRSPEHEEWPQWVLPE